MAGAGLGLRLHDRRHGTGHHHAAFDPWWAHARDHYLDLAQGAAPELVSLYYDPILDVHHKLPVMAGLSNCFYLAPQVPEETRRLFDAAVAGLGVTEDGVARLDLHRSAAIAWFLAREWGIDDLDARLAQAFEANWEPTWDGSRAEFTWGLGLGEVHPRGQFNAFLAAAEAVSPGAWQRLADTPMAEEAQVVDVDFPTVAFSEARWVDGRLRLRMVAVGDHVAGATTSFSVTGLDAPPAWQLRGPDASTVEVSGPSSVLVTCPLGVHPLVLTR